MGGLRSTASASRSLSTTASTLTTTTNAKRLRTPATTRSQARRSRRCSAGSTDASEWAWRARVASHPPASQLNIEHAAGAGQQQHFFLAVHEKRVETHALYSL